MGITAFQKFCTEFSREIRLYFYNKYEKHSQLDQKLIHRDRIRMIFEKHVQKSTA